MSFSLMQVNGTGCEPWNPFQMLLETEHDNIIISFEIFSNWCTNLHLVVAFYMAIRCQMPSLFFLRFLVACSLRLRVFRSNEQCITAIRQPSLYAQLFCSCRRCYARELPVIAVLTVQ
uniref:Uncharacterized protein n=1 Tax=Schistocephalus solidus TaxID=70667 RepID=A0A0V0J355_SCHSO